MELERLSFEECLKEAQRLGYAEADPTFDIGGFDTAHKLAILASLAFGTRIAPEAVDVEGIERVTLADIDAADELGFRIKLLGVAQRTAQGIEQRVHPTMVRKTTSIAQVMGVTNAVTIDADAVHELTLVGPGAGGDATASAVVADIADIARGVRSAPFGLPSASAAQARARAGARCTRAAITSASPCRTCRAPSPPSPRAWPSATSRSRASCSMARARRGAAAATAPVGVILITHATTERLVREALDAIYADGTIAEPAQVIRIERE